jgi:hypothetical protein
MMVLGLTTNLVPDLQRSEGEKLVTGTMLSQYPPKIDHMVKTRRGTHRILTTTTLRMAITVKMKLLPAIRPICHLLSIRHSTSQREV